MRSRSAVRLITLAALERDMDGEIVPPERRSCELCGRTDVWDGSAENWVIAVEDGERRVGNKHCIHEWDINGRYNPVVSRSDGEESGG